MLTDTSRDKIHHFHHFFKFFLNFDSNYQYFTAVIFASDFLGFPFIPEDFYLGKKVQIIGIIKEYNGSPEIIVKTPDQIRILSQNQHIFWKLL
ncbi:MAG: hypothetical protein HXS44_05800 [Theionarchaea archaeon]|nr:hypothetical protein [Theionarchaea archaeon]